MSLDKKDFRNIMVSIKINEKKGKKIG